MPGGSGSRYHPCTASSRDGRRLAPTVSPSMGSGWHQVALALPLARITGMQVTPAQCRPLAVTRLRAGGRGFTVALRVPAGGGPPSVPPSAPLPSNIPQDTNGGGRQWDKGTGATCGTHAGRQYWCGVPPVVAPRYWERSKRHRHAGAEFLYQRHQLALVGPA